MPGPPASPLDGRTGARPRVLLADDYLPLLTAMERLLQEDSDVVSQVSTVAELLQEARAHRPDVVVMDLSLAAGSGIDVCRRLRVDHPEVRIVVISASDDDDIRAAVLNAGASAFVSKALMAERLIPAIRDGWFPAK